MLQENNIYLKRLLIAIIFLKLIQTLFDLGDTINATAYKIELGRFHDNIDL